MGHIKSFDEFLNEVKLSPHWIERTWNTAADAVKPDINPEFDINKSISRVKNLKNSHKDGWTCNEVIDLQTNRHINIADFLNDNSIEFDIFNERIAYTLHTFLTGNKVKDLKYGKENTPSFKKYKSVFLGKIVYKINGKKFSPVLNASFKGKPMWAGNNVWGAFKNYDNAITILYHPDLSKETSNKIKDHTFEIYKDSEAGGSKIDFDNTYAAVFPFGRQFEIIISNDDDWKDQADIQAGNKKEELRFVDIKVDDDKKLEIDPEKLPYFPQGEYSRRKPIQIKVSFLVPVKKNGKYVYDEDGKSVTENREAIRTYDAFDDAPEKSISSVKFTTPNMAEFKQVVKALKNSNTSYSTSGLEITITNAYKSNYFK
ncbi:hypothetical protein M0P25_04350 [archaeon]|jgi:hypothetical protein|nr:hypothetical protein [archaeon]MCK9439510.1 hypothetical protein [Patescibacteria group bacterium]